MSSHVVNPTNAAPNPRLPVPFTTQKHMKAVSVKRNDLFNTGKDYMDEGLPALTTEMEEQSVKARPKYSGGVSGGITDPHSAAMDFFNLSHMDESAQGSHINYQDKGVVVDVDAKLIVSSMEEMSKGRFREAHYPTLEKYLQSDYCRRLRESSLRMRKIVDSSQKSYFRESGKKGFVMTPAIANRFRKVDGQILTNLKEAVAKELGLKPGQKRLLETSKRLKETIFSDDPFSLDAGSGSSFFPSFDMQGNGRPQDFIPLLSGPFNKQLYWADYLDMHSKAYQAWTHNPIAKRIVKVLTQFVLGKGVKATVISAELPTGKLERDQKTGKKYETVFDLREKAQSILDDHWKRNSMGIRGKQILQDLIVFGEQFPRYFDAPWGLKVRQIDPSTVWEVVTDPDDCENEFYLHQQYPTRYQWYVDLPIPTIKFIIRQVPAKTYYHMKINYASGEVRGRSELFAILGWLKRLKEFASDRVIRNKMANLFCIDVAVEGTAADVQQAKSDFSIVPTPGSFYIHNKAATLEGIEAKVGASDVQGDLTLLFTVIAMGAGVSKDYLGMGEAGGGKAQALLGTEPDVKTFENYQEIMEQFFLQDADRCFQRAKDLGKMPSGVQIKVEITYPALAEENVSEKLKDIGFAESMSWITHRRAATMGAKELQITTYDYDEEQEEVSKEDAEQEIVFQASMAQVLKGQAETPKGAGGAGASSGSGGSDNAAGGGGIPGLPASGGGGATTPAAAESERGKGWGNAHPRAVAESLFREARNTDIVKRPIDRRRHISRTPDKTRDQMDMNPARVVKRGRKGLKRRYNEAAGGMEPFKPGDGEQIQDPNVFADARMPTKTLRRKKPVTPPVQKPMR